MFAAPKTADLPAGSPTAPAEEPIKEEETKEPNDPIDLTEEKIVDIIKAEDVQKEIDPVSENILIEPLVKPSTAKKTKATNKDKPTSPDPESDVNKKEKDADVPKLKESKVYIGCRVSNEMKNALEAMAKDFAYLARKNYGLKIKDDSSSIQRAFLLLGMSCFTEKVRHKALQEYDPESPMQDEVSQQLLALMRIHKVEIDDIDF